MAYRGLKSSQALRRRWPALADNLGEVLLATWAAAMLDILFVSVVVECAQADGGTAGDVGQTRHGVADTTTGN